MTMPLYNIRFILLISASFITIFSSIAIYFCLPLIISNVVRTQLSLSPTSGSYDGWRMNSVIDKFYLYNITNLDEIMNFNELFANSNKPINKPLPKIKQIGPFVYRQDREKTNINFDSTNETVTYDQVKRWSFMNQESQVKTIQDLNSTWINHINIPLAGTSLNPEYAEFVDPVVHEFNLSLFLNHSVNVLLFEGYFDILMEQAKSSGQIDVDRFGWLYNQNNSITKNIRIFTGPSNSTLDKIGAIDEFNFNKKLNIWHHNNTEPKDTNNVQCNDFRFSSAGELFPPPKNSIISHNNHYKDDDIDDTNSNNNKNLKQLTDLSNLRLKINTEDSSLTGSNSDQLNNIPNSQDNQQHYQRAFNQKSISLFMPDLCRIFRLFYNNTYNFKGLSVDRYTADKFTYDYTSQLPNKPSATTSSIILARSNSQLINSNNNIDLNETINSNRCYCIYNETSKLTSCPPNGMMDLFTCQKGSPLTISFPHFHHSTQDPILKPYLGLFKDESDIVDKSEHEFYIDLESTLNIPINAQIVIQFNVHFKDEQSLKFLHEYSHLFENPITGNRVQDLYLPAMWFKSSAQIDDENLARLKFIQQHLHLVTPITTIIMFGVASILLMMSAKLAYDLSYGQNKMSAGGHGVYKGRWNYSLSECNKIRRDRDEIGEECHLDSRE